MKTKTLLIAAATLAVGIISSQAAVYSQNIVGYYNTAIGPSQFVFVSAQMQSGAGGYAVNDLLTNGVPDQSTLYIWTGSGYGKTLVYYAGYGWYDGADLATNQIGGGVGAFLLSGDTVNTNTITIIGTVPQGGFTNTIASGFGVYALPYPVSTNIDSSLVGFPSQDQDTYFAWNPVSQSFSDTYIYYAGYGWYSGATQVYPQPKVGEAFFYENASGSIQWTNSFSVQ